MRWLPFFILLYLAGALQFAGLGRLSTGAYPRIEYLPMLGIFYALFAEEQLAPLAALLCGAAYDLLSPDPMGVYAIALGLVALGVLQVRLSVFRDQKISQLILTILALLAFGLLAFLIGGILGAFPGRAWAVWGSLSANAIYSGVVAPLIFWGLLKFQPTLGFPVLRRTPR